jgi:hypothetical protein
MVHTMSDILHFQPNVPVEVALAYSTGRQKELGKPLLFTLTDGRIMFLPVSVADQIARRAIKPRQPFFLCRFKPGRGALDRWRVWLPGEPVPQPDGEFAIKETPEPLRSRRILSKVQSLRVILAIVSDDDDAGSLQEIREDCTARLHQLGFEVHHG